MTTDLGTDLATLADGDLDPTFGLLSGPALVARDLQAEIFTIEGALWYAPEYGLGLAAHVAKRVTPPMRAALASRIRALCLRDDRVASVQVEVSGELAVAVEGVTAIDEAFQFVVNPASAAASLAETP